MAYIIEDYREAERKLRESGDTEKALMVRRRIVEMLTPAQMARDKAEYSPTGTGMENFTAGIGQGMVNVGRHAGNLVGAVSDEDMARAKERDAPLLDTTGGMVGSMVGEAAVTAPMAMGATGVLARGGAALAKGAPAMSRFIAPATKALSSPLGRGMAEGAAQGALMADPGEGAEGATRGAMWGAAVPIAGGIVGKALHGMKRTPQAQALLDAGVDLTPGQMNPKGAYNLVETASKKIPVAGNMITAAQDEGMRTFQRAAAKRAAMPGAAVDSDDAASMIRKAYESFEPYYAQGRGHSLAPDLDLKEHAAKALGSKSAVVTDEARKRATAIVNNLLTKRAKSTDDLMDIRSAIRQAERKARQVGDTLQTDTADLLEKVDDSLTKVLNRSLPPAAAKAVKKADRQYPLLKTLEDAAWRAKDIDGGFRPQHLANAVQGSMKGAGKQAYAQGGGGPLRELSEAGMSVFNAPIPPTGATLIPLGALGAAGIALPKAVTAPIGAGLFSLAATKTGRKAAQGNLGIQKAARSLTSKADQRIPGYVKEAIDQMAKRLTVAGGSR